ncbi:MAG TPA: response regulator [Candidatus Saccharimonadales bacterium]|nr:response regulator [Candidatus Saccharimonadales bacterium]
MDSSDKKIAVVEDNVALADIYKTRMELLGYKCIAVSDGETAFGVLQQELPDLVLLDLMMPKVSGDQLLARIRQTDWGRSMKVLIVSNLSEEDAPEGLRDLGIEGYAIKANLTGDQIDRLVNGILA